MAAAVALLAALVFQGESPSPSFDDFPVFVWRQDFQGQTLPARIFEPFGGVNVEGSGSIPTIEGQDHPAHFYVGHAPGREELHLRRTDPWYDQMWKRWYEERNDQELVRQPCLSNPKTKQTLFANLERSLAARTGSRGSAISLGDEIGLTPAGDPLDFCHSEFCSASAPRESSVSTDRARLAWLDEDPSFIGPWLARRRFQAGVLHDLVSQVADRAQELAPGAPRALFGVKTQTAFGGIDIARALHFVEWIEPYGDTVTRELCFTLRRPGQRVFATLFPANDRPERAALRLAEHVLRGGDGAVIWSDRHLARSPAYLERLSEAVRGTRKLRARLRAICGGNWSPQTAAWAIVEDADNVALCFLRDSLGDGATWPRRFAGYQVENGTREKQIHHWLRVLERAQLRPGALPWSELLGDSPRGGTRRFPVLLLIEQAILSRENEQALKRHLESGGIIVVQGHFAEFTPEGTKRTSPLEGWLERFPGRVIQGPENTAQVESCVERVNQIAALESSPLKVKEPGVLFAEHRLEDGRRIVGMLPIPKDSEAPLMAAELHLRLNEEWRLVEVLSEDSDLSLTEEPGPAGLPIERWPLRAGLRTAEPLYVLIMRNDK